MIAVGDKEMTAVYALLSDDDRLIVGCGRYAGLNTDKRIRVRLQRVSGS